jgi:Flp pilus assembly protein TadG
MNSIVTILRTTVGAATRTLCRMLGPVCAAGDRCRSAVRAEDGDTLVEFALTFHILAALLFGLIQVCIAFYAYEAISDLAREGTRYAIVHGSTCETGAGASCTATASSIQTYVKGIGLLNSNSLTVTATFPDGTEAPGSRVKVVVQYTSPYKIPWMTTSPISMSSTSEMYIIQ